MSGIGVDATIIDEFHLLREALPGLFWHRVVNQFYFAAIGFMNVMRRRCDDFQKRVKLRCDGIEYPLDEGIEVLLNLVRRAFSYFIC